MRADERDSAKEQQAFDLLVANRILGRTLPPLSARSTADPPPPVRPVTDPPLSARPYASRQISKGNNKPPRNPSVKQLLGQLEAKLSGNVLPGKFLATSASFNSNPLHESHTSTLKACASGQLGASSKMAPADIQACLRNVSMAFGEVIELLPSYRQLLIKVQESYDSLVMHALEELCSTATLRSRLKVLSTQLQQLEGGHLLFPAENSWTEACNLRRQLTERGNENKSLEDECRKLQDKIGKQAGELRHLKVEVCKTQCKLTNLEASDTQSKKIAVQKSTELAEKRWCVFFLWAKQHISENDEIEQDDTMSSSSDEEQPPLSRVSSRRHEHEGAPISKSPKGALACSCGSIFMPDASFCRKCGKPRGEGRSSPRVLRRLPSCGSGLQCRSSLTRRVSLPADFTISLAGLPSPSEPPPLIRLESNGSGILSRRLSGGLSGGLSAAHTDSSKDLFEVVRSLVVKDHPENWGITVEQLRDFWDEIKDDLHDYCEAHAELVRDNTRFHICLDDHCEWHHHETKHEAVSCLSDEEKELMTALSANMHLVVNRYIKPQTAPCGKSYALMKNPMGKKTNIFITHVWSDRFKNFVHTLRRALSENDVVWVCSFAMPQNSTDEIQALLDTKDLRDCPFGIALRHAESHVVILDEDAVVPTRSWCTYEINLGSNLNKPMLLWPHHMENLEELRARVEDLNMETARATRKEDEDRIKDDIRKMGGFEALNKRLRSLLLDRLRFAQDVILAGKQDREGIMHTFRQKLDQEQEEHKKCQLRLAELSQELEAALDSGNSKRVGEVCDATTSLKMDRQLQACWEGMKKLHIMLEFQPLKANATPVHAMQMMCNALVRMHKEYEDCSFTDVGRFFCNAFERELDNKGLVNLREDVIKFIAQVKPPREFSAFFLPSSCQATWEAFGQQQAQEKAKQIVSQRTIEDDQQLFQERLAQIDSKMRGLDVTYEVTSTTPRRSSQPPPGFSQDYAAQKLLWENYDDVRRMLEVLHRIRCNTELAERAHRDELEKTEVANRRITADLRAQIHDLEESKDIAIRKARSAEQQLAAKTVEDRILHLREEIDRMSREMDEVHKKLDEKHKQQRRSDDEAEELSREIETMKEELRKNEALAEQWQQRAVQLQDKLNEQMTTTQKFRLEANRSKMESEIAKLKPQEEAKTPIAAIKSLCNALVLAADEQQLGHSWYECFQEFFQDCLKNIPSQKEAIENCLCKNGGTEFQIRFLPRRRRSRTSWRAKSKELSHASPEDALSPEALSDWESDDRPASAPELFPKRGTMIFPRHSALASVPPEYRARKTYTVR